MAKAPKVGEPIPLDVIEPTSPVIDETVLAVGGQSDTVDDVQDVATSIVSETAEAIGDRAEIVEEQTEGSTRTSAEQGDRAGDVNPLSVVAVLPLVVWAAIAASYLRTITFLATDHWIGRQA
ncbi:hypothetical protein [Pararhizobium sp. A13]|uniref:hypothetical protein n=1 Tax=Pararhizobium sp. A13 TaxID=3133975 RepID=UPI00311B2009